MKACIVVPTIREDNIKDFLSQWERQFEGIDVIVVEDNPEKSFDLCDSKAEHYSWAEIDMEFGKDAWIIPRRTDCVRSFGYYKAFLKKTDMIITLDDDCYPHENYPDFIDLHWKRLQESCDESWISTVDGVNPRGIPYYKRSRNSPVILNHGLWYGVPDYDAPTQLMASRRDFLFTHINQTIAKGKYFPMCGMNVSWKPELTPAFYFLLMGRNYKYDRFGDIWTGVIIKKICDHLGFAVNSGEPAIEHKRASNVWSNLQKEAPGLIVNEDFWELIDSIVLTKTTVKECYRELAEKLPLNDEYWEKTRKAMIVWSELF